MKRRILILMAMLQMQTPNMMRRNWLYKLINVGEYDMIIFVIDLSVGLDISKRRICESCDVMRVGMKK